MYIIHVSLVNHKNELTVSPFFAVFTQTNLEKHPCHEVPPQDLFRVPKPGTMQWENASDEHKAFVDAIMDRLRQRAEQRRVLAKPIFQDFDK